MSYEQFNGARSWPEITGDAKTVGRPVQKFLDKLQEDLLAELPDRKTEADKERERQMMINSGENKLLGLDPFNYSIEESREKEIQEREYPMGTQVVTSNIVVNKLGRRTPLDLFHMYKSGKGEKGFGPAGNFLRNHFAQSMASFKEKKNWVYNRSFDQNVSDRALSGKKLAAELQLKYLKHFELISQGRWNVLLDYASDDITSEAMHACQGLERETVRSFFDVKLVSNNKKPKVLSFFEFEQQGMEFQQVLVRFDMNVECLSFENDVSATAGEVLSDLSAAPNDVAELRQERMLKYAVFEKRADDFLSKYRLIGTVSEEEIEENKRSSFEFSS
eukprot:sb/3466601/